MGTYLKGSLFEETDYITRHIPHNTQFQKYFSLYCYEPSKFKHQFITRSSLYSVMGLFRGVGGEGAF